MPRKPCIPKYALHKPSGQARIILDGRHRYLGPYNSPESRAAYAQVLTERFLQPQGAATSAALPTPPSLPCGQFPFPALSVNELIVRYLTFAKGYYVKDGTPTGEIGNIKDAARPLQTLYGHTNVATFGPKALKAVRQAMIELEDLCRGVVNARIDRIKQMFRWGVSEELVPPTVYEGLRSVSGLRRDRTEAREASPVGPADEKAVETTMSFLPPQIADMVRLQRLTGMRSGSLVLLRPCDLDRSGEVWVYEPSSHKTQHHGRRLRILIGPEGQRLLKPCLENRMPLACVFSPREVAQWRLEQRRRTRPPRRTPRYPSEQQRVEAKKRRPPKRPLAEHYTTATYRRAIEYAIELARNKGSSWPTGTLTSFGTAGD